MADTVLYAFTLTILGIAVAFRFFNRWPPPLLLILVGIFATVAGLRYDWPTIDLYEHGLRTPGVVTKLESALRDGRAVVIVSARFKDAKDREYRFKNKETWPYYRTKFDPMPPDVDDKVTVIYDPSDPAGTATINVGGFMMLFRPGCAVFVGVAFVLSGLGRLRRRLMGRR
jgi:hypothetical protein